jgi:NDP-sugar pyrophosphorylase family protein
MASTKIDLVILAGGKGSRLKKYLGNLPKPMIRINKKSFLSYLINNASVYSFNKILKANFIKKNLTLFQ